MISLASVLPDALLAGLLALLLWAVPGVLLARGLGFSRGVAWALAPALGWATQTALALAAGLVVGLSVPLVGLVTLALAVAGLLLARARGDDAVELATARVPVVALLLAAALAVVPALAVLPKVGADGAIAFASPIYDHAKIALIDEIARHTRLPPANPVYGAGGSAGVVSYYYLWHFGAAELALLSGAGGWAADAAASWFSAFAALALVSGLAFLLRPGAAAPLLALLAAATGSLRPVAEALIGPQLHGLIEPATGLAGLLYQASWSPHHVAAASCVVLAVLLMAQLADEASRVRRAALTILLALVVAAGFQSSFWVGGVTFAVAGGAAALVLVAGAPARGRLIARLVAAAVLALMLAAPLLQAQAQAAAARGGGVPLRLEPFPVLGPWVPEAWRTVWNVPAFWLVLLPVEFPALILAGVMGALLMARNHAGGRPRALIALVLASLLVSALLVSTAGENNDLGWRAVLPAVLVLSAFAGVALAAALSAARGGRGVLIAMGVLIALGLPDTLALAGRNISGEASADGRVFARDGELWRAVRGVVGADVRIASNPDRLAKLTPWPINLSWALLAQRRSCFAGNEMALAFAPLDAAAREAASELFARVFAGAGTPADVAELHTAYGCGAAVVTGQDGAFGADPFAESPLYRLAQEEAGRWRIYVATAGRETGPH